MLDDGLAPTNPLDVWGTGADTRNLFGACLRAMADDPGVAVTALAVDLVTEFDGDTAYADAVLDVANNTDAPMAVLASVPSAIDAPTAQRLRDSGIPVLEGFRSGLAALGHLARWPLPVDRPDEPARRRAAGPRRGRRRSNCWRPTGFRLCTSRTAHSIGEALAAADELGYPVALKTFGALHKSDVGGVALDLADDAALSLAYTAMAQSLGPAVTVQPMVADGVEVSVGFVRDDGLRSAAGRRGRRHPGGVARRPGGGVSAGVACGRAGSARPSAHSPAAGGLARCAGGRHRRAGGCDRGFLARWRSNSATSLDAVEANPVIASPRGVVAVDALVQARRAES